MTQIIQRKRSPNFPFVGVKECVHYITKLHSKVQTNKLPLKLAYGHMGLTSNSSTTDRIRASMLSYGLTSEEYIEKEKWIRLTDLSNKIVLDNRESNRLAALRQAALNDPMMKKVWNSDWKRGLPDEATVISVLRIDYHFLEDGAKRFSAVIRDNYQFCELATFYEFATNEIVGETPPPASETNQNIKDHHQKEGSRDERQSDLVQYPIPLDNGRLASISLPSSISDDDAEYILDFINLLLKKLRKGSSKINTTLE